MKNWDFSFVNLGLNIGVTACNQFNPPTIINSPCTVTHWFHLKYCGQCFGSSVDKWRNYLNFPLETLRLKQTSANLNEDPYKAAKTQTKTTARREKALYLDPERAPDPQLNVICAVQLSPASQSAAACKFSKLLPSLKARPTQCVGLTWQSWLAVNHAIQRMVPWLLPSDL